MNNPPEKQIRAHYNDSTIRVYQAFNNQIADSALKAQTFVSPPFKMSRMTWIKPSFLWTMYRSGWAKKDENQVRILAIDISHEGFSWALRNSCPSKPDSDMEWEDWLELKERSPVRIQWDPERDLKLEPLLYRSIQIGISGKAVDLYVHNWIAEIQDVTSLAHEIHDLVISGKIDDANQKLPNEHVYTPVGITI